MADNPLISVFIPAYNVEAFVHHAIESVLGQTYSNYQLIVINDASTDRTGEVIHRYQHHPQIKIYHNPTNLGVGGNWNKGVSLCHGEFIVRLDADDFYEPEYLQKVISLFEQYPETQLVFTGANLLYQNGRCRVDLPYKDSWVRPGREFLPDLLRVCRVWSPTVCARRSCYERLGKVIPEMSIHEDWELWVRFATAGQVAYLAEPMVNIHLLNPMGCTHTAIIKAQSPIACRIWLDKLATDTLPYQLTYAEQALLKQGMYDMVMAFAVFAQEAGLNDSVQKHLEFARSLLPENEQNSLQSRLYVRAAEIYFMEGGYHLKGWKFLLQSLRYGFLASNAFKQPKLWARAFLGKTVFEFLREHFLVRHRFPNVGIEPK
jgi:glycosyltransferase involved in cell wall biosynthesis